MNLEAQIINQLFHNERYGRDVLPYLSSEYFENEGNRTVFEYIEKYTKKYQNLPTPTAIRIELEQDTVNEKVFDSAKEVIDQNQNSRPVDYDWLRDQTEKYCKDRAVHNALRESIGILGDEKRASGEIEELLRKALAVSFDSELGLDVLEDAERQYDMSHGEAVKIPFLIDAFNRATEGGAESKTLNILQAGCIDPNTPVTIRYLYDGIPRTVVVQVKRIKQLLEEGIEVTIHSPDGFVPVSQYVDKGYHDEYVLTLEDRRHVYCNGDHLFKTNLYGWMTAKEIMQLTPGIATINICTDKGLVAGQVTTTGKVGPIVDLVINHPEHRYYANGVESHNTNVGKSLILCHLAGDYLLQGKNVLYISFEMSEEKVAARIYGNILDVALDNQKKMPKKWFLEKIADVKKKTQGRLKIKEYPSGSAHTGHIRHHIQELKLKTGFVPDVIIFDYLGIMASSRYKVGGVAKHTYLQSVAQEQRALCQEQEAIGWTAVQVNRGGFDNSDPTITDVGESWGIPAEADWYLVVSQGEDLEELNQFLCRQEKSRYSNKDKMRKFIIGVDKDKQRIYDVDNSQQNIHNASVKRENEEEDDDPFGKFMQRG